MKIPLGGEVRLLFCDAGFEPVLREGSITLGPEQLALVGVGDYAEEKFDLGVQADVVIPAAMCRLQVAFSADGEKAICATIDEPGGRNFRVVLRQTDLAGVPKRSSGGSPPAGKKMSEVLVIEASQGGREIPLNPQ